MSIVPQKATDDNEMMKQIQATHESGGYEFDVKPLLEIVEGIFQRVEDIFQRATTGAPDTVQGAAQAQLDALDEKPVPNGFHDMLKHLSYTISRISCQISCKCPGDGDAHATTLAIFKTLSSYTWEAKVALALVALSVNYGDFCLVPELYPTNPLGKLVILLKQLPETPKSEELNKLMKAMLEVAKCIVEFKNLPSKYISPDTPEMLTATAHIPTAVYYIVACASQIMGLIGNGQKYIPSTTETSELSRLAHKINSIYGHLQNQLTLCYQHRDKYKQIVILFKTIHIDNMKIIKALINDKDDQLPLFHCYEKKRVRLDVLRRKNVLLLISDIDLSHHELSILDRVYQESRHMVGTTESQYEVVWLPVVDRSTPWDETKKTQFESLQGKMSWYSVYDPSSLDLIVIKYIKEEWKLNKQPLLVVLDPQGRVVNPNAIHMMWIWGNLAFPFTSWREDTLWEEASCKIELLVDKNVAPNFDWTTEDYICLYGGKDAAWIRKFTAIAKVAAAQATEINLKMLYVGKRNPNKDVKDILSTINKEKLSHTLTDVTGMRFFWVRLGYMWHYKMQHDPIMQEIFTMLCFDESDQGWAVICKGRAEMAKGKGDTILNTFNDYKLWKDRVDQKGFIPALKDYLQQLHTPQHCNRLILPGSTGSIPERVVCAECGRPMEKFIMYRCCTDDEY